MACGTRSRLRFPQFVAKTVPGTCALAVTCFSHLLSLHVAIIESPLNSAIHGIDMEIVQAMCRNGELCDIDSRSSWGNIMRETLLYFVIHTTIPQETFIVRLGGLGARKKVSILRFGEVDWSSPSYCYTSMYVQSTLSKAGHTN